MIKLNDLLTINLDSDDLFICNDSAIRCSPEPCSATITEAGDHHSFKLQVYAAMADDRRALASTCTAVLVHNEADPVIEHGGGIETFKAYTEPTRMRKNPCNFPTQLLALAECVCASTANS